MAVAIGNLEYEFLRDYLRRESGLSLDTDKAYLLETRLNPLLTKRGWSTFAQLCQTLRGPDPTIRFEVIEAMTTHETYFFRDPSQFTVLRKSVIPHLRRRVLGRSINIWSAAVSSGQEAYTLAMMLMEEGVLSGRVLGTDISEAVLRKARKGQYRTTEIRRGLMPDQVQRYFRQNGDDYEVSGEVKKMIEFKRFDLREDARTLGTFDVILCRNVLIYFDQPTRDKVLLNLHSALAPHGYLLLGGAESATHLREHFRVVDENRVLLYARR